MSNTELNSKSSDFENRPTPKRQEEDLLSLFRSYLSYWPIYLLVLVLCGVLAWIYIASRRPLYTAETIIEILDNKDAENRAVAGVNLDDLGFGNKSTDIDKELLLLKSRKIVQKAIEESRFYVDISTRQGLHPHVLYEEVPYTFSLEDGALSAMKKSYSFEVSTLADGKFEVLFPAEDEQKEKVVRIDSLPASFGTPVGVVAMLKNEDYTPDSLKNEAYTSSESEPLKTTVTLSPSMSMARSLAKEGLSVQRVDKNTSIAKIAVTSDNRKKGQTFLEKLVEVYNRERSVDKNITAQGTYDFINVRIDEVSKELSEIEAQLESIKKDQGLKGVQEPGLAVNSGKQIEKLRLETETDLRLMDYLLDYLNDPSKKFELVPNLLTAEGMQGSGAALASTIQAHNAMIMERNTLVKEAGDKHPRLRAINHNIEQSRENIRSATEISRNGLEIKLEDILQQEEKYNETVSEAPEFERKIAVIERERTLRSEIYLLLLTQREKTSIELATSMQSASIIDSPLAATVPSSPKKPVIYLGAFILGLLLTTGGIFIFKASRVKVSSQEDLESLTSLPLLGIIPKTKFESKKDEIQVKIRGNSLMTEVFRTLRTNLGFLAPKSSSSIVLVTSTAEGQGKTFVAANLAVSLSALDKKVLLVGLDLRNPQLGRIFNDGKDKLYYRGIVDLLGDPGANPEDFLVRPESYPNLAVLYAGPIPPNPPELMARSRLTELFEVYREQYDYIILDSAPVGPVVDTFTLSRVADVTLFVLRSAKTQKRDVAFVNYIAENGKLPHIGIVLNDVARASAFSRKKYGYGYGYGLETEKKG